MFYRRRLAQVAKDHHIAIDGTLKQDISRANDLSDFSYKAESGAAAMCPSCMPMKLSSWNRSVAEVFPGNSIDASSYPAFIRNNDIRKGIIVADRGFPPSKIKEELRECPELSFLMLIKRNDSRISWNRTRILILKQHISVTLTASSWNLSLTAIKTMSASNVRTYKVISWSWGTSS